MGRFLHAHLNRVFGNGADDEESEQEEIPTKKSRKPEPAPVKPPTQLESARAALAKAEETVLNIQRQLRELDAHRDDLPALAPKGPIAERLERDAQLAQIASSRTALNKELSEAQAFRGRRQSELASVLGRAAEAARTVRYYQDRLVPLQRQSPVLQEALGKLQSVLTPEFREVVGQHQIGMIMNAIGSIESLLRNQLPRAQSDYDTAIAEAERIGAPQ